MVVPAALKELIEDDSQEAMVFRDDPIAQPRLDRQFSASQLKVAILQLVAVRSAV